MKPSRTTIFLAVAAALLAAYIWTWEREDDAARSERDAARAAFRFDPAEIAAVAIRRGDSTISCVRTPSGGWRLAAPIAARADADAVERLLSSLHDLPLANLVMPSRRDPAAYAAYGLDPPRAVVELVESPSRPPRRLLVGARTPLGDGVYARAEGHPAVVRVPDDLPDRLPASAEVLRDHALVRGDPAAVVRLDIRGPAGYLQLARDPAETWRLYQPFTTRADTASVTAIIDAILSCSIVQFVQDNVRDLAPYGLDSRSAVTAVLGTSDGSGSRVVSVGDPLPNAPSLVYARLQAENSVYAVPAALRRALLVRPDDLRDRRVPGLSDPAAIQRFRIEEHPRALEAFRDPDGLWHLAAPFAADADSAAVEALLRSWRDVHLAAFPATPSSAPADWPRTVRLTLRDQPEAPLLFRLAPADPETQAPADSCWISLANDATVAFASPATLLSMPLDPSSCLTRELASVPETDIASVVLSPPAPAEPSRYTRNPDGTWTPDTPALRAALPLLAPLRAAAYLPPDAPPPGNPTTLEIALRGETGIALALSFATPSSDAPPAPAPATLRGRPLPFTLPSSTVSALSALDLSIPPAPPVPLP